MLWEKLWNLLTISNEEELKLFTDNEKLLKRYQKQLFDLSHNKDFKEMLMNEIIEENALFDQTYGVGYRDGIEKGIQKGIEQNKIEIILEMKKDNVSLELISKYVNLSINEIKEIIANNN